MRKVKWVEYLNEFLLDIVVPEAAICTIEGHNDDFFEMRNTCYGSECLTVEPTARTRLGYAYNFVPIERGVATCPICCCDKRFVQEIFKIPAVETELVFMCNSLRLKT